MRDKIYYEMDSSDQEANEQNRTKTKRIDIDNIMQIFDRRKYVDSNFRMLCASEYAAAAKLTWCSVLCCVPCFKVALGIVSR